MERNDELSRDALGKLYPIALHDWDARWSAWFEEERDFLFSTAPHYIESIQHIGSTAIPGMHAKPTIDMLIAIREEHNFKPELISLMQHAGYHYIFRSDFPPPYMMFVKGYLEGGLAERSFHVHMAPLSHVALHERALFCEYLREHPEEAAAYQALKENLALTFRTDREAYTYGKTNFVNSAMDRAREWSKKRREN